MKRHVLLLTLLIVLISAGLIAFFLTFSELTPSAASTQAEAIDRDLLILFTLATPVLVFVLVFVVYSAIVFRRRPGDREDEDGPPIEGHRGIEVAWVLVPLAIVLATASYSTVVLRDITKAQDGELEVNVTAFQWGWRFEYPAQGVISTELRLPLGRPVVLKLHSQDVIHSFWVPEFRVKQDAVPGMENHLRLTPRDVGDFATREARYQVLCAELCGLGHAFMVAPVTVVSVADFDRWLAEQGRR